MEDIRKEEEGKKTKNIYVPLISILLPFYIVINTCES